MMQALHQEQQCSLSEAGVGLQWWVAHISSPLYWPENAHCGGRESRYNNIEDGKHHTTHPRIFSSSPPPKGTGSKAYEHGDMNIYTMFCALIHY